MLLRLIFGFVFFNLVLQYIQAQPATCVTCISCKDVYDGTDTNGTCSSATSCQKIRIQAPGTTLIAKACSTSCNAQTIVAGPIRLDVTCCTTSNCNTATTITLQPILSDIAPPPYLDDAKANTQGPSQYPGGQPYANQANIQGPPQYSGGQPYVDQATTQGPSQYPGGQPYANQANTQGPPQYPGGQPYVNQANIKDPSQYPGGQPYANQANIQGPPQYPGGPTYVNQAYTGPPNQYGGGPSVIIMQQPRPKVVFRQSGTSHGLCCIICILTGGLSIPCWICSCI